jgi:hypothetical protein
VCLASALLTAYEATGALPYSMLAEELMQVRGVPQHDFWPGATPCAYGRGSPPCTTMRRIAVPR